jgi:hypothetical protein
MASMARRVAKNIRFRADQIERLNALTTDETDFSKLVRKAVDQFLLASDRAREESPPYKARRLATLPLKQLPRSAKRKLKGPPSREPR